MVVNPVNIGLRRTATQTGVSKVSKPVPQPHQESDIPPLDTNELYDTLQYRNDKSETGCSSELEQWLIEHLKFTMLYKIDIQNDLSFCISK